MKNKSNVLPYLCALAPVVFLYAFNIGEMQLFDTLPALVTVIFLAWSFAFVSKRVLADIDKGNLFSGVVLTIMLVYNNIYVALNEVVDIRHRFLMPIVFMTLFVLLLLIKKAKKLHVVLIDFLTVVISVFIFISLINISTYWLNIKGQRRLMLDKEITQKLSKHEANYPDVYYIILDGYSSGQVLEKYYGYDNGSFLRGLEELGFATNEDAKSNYAMTYLSLASSLNMQYINDVKSKARTDKDMKILEKMITNNKVMNTFKDRGYKIVHLGAAWGPTNTNPHADVSIRAYRYINLFTLTLMRTSILNHLYEKIWRNLSHNVTLSQFDNLKKIPENSEPTFSFVHVCSPHPPYVFGENGEDYSYVNPISGGKDTGKLQFLSQLKYINKRVLETIGYIISNSSSKPIIVIQADHAGSIWEFSDKYSKDGVDTFRGRHGILNTFLAPQVLTQKLLRHKTPVNTFAEIMNYLFEEGIEINEDKVYYSYYEAPYEFKDVSFLLNE